MFARCHLLLYISCVVAIDEPLSKGTQQVCAFGTGDSRLSCTQFDIICNTSSSVEIVNAICGIRHDSSFKSCIHYRGDCKTYNDCCRNEEGDQRAKMPSRYYDQLSRNCSKKKECHVPAPVQLLMQDADNYEIHYCSVVYRCVSVSVPPTLAPTSQHDYSEIRQRSGMPVTPQNNVSAKTKTQTSSPSVTLAAIVVPVILVTLAIATATALLLRRRRLESKHSPDIKSIDVKNSSEHRNSNTYDSVPTTGLSLPCTVSIVHKTANDDSAAISKGTLCKIKNRDCNNYITFDPENIPDIDSSSNVYNDVEGQHPYIVTDPEHAKRGDIFRTSKEVETSIDCHALNFESEMVENDKNNYYAEMTGQSNTEDYVNLEIDADDKDISFDADHSPYHIIDPHDPYTARAFLQIQRSSFVRKVGSTSPEIDKEVYTPDADVNPYHILEPLETNTVSDTKHIHEQMPGVTVETSADDNDYNKISFKINNVTTDMRSGTMRTIMSDDTSDYSHLYGKDIRQLSVSFLDDTVEYSHLGDNNTCATKVMCDSDNQYSHISLPQETRPRVF